MSVIPLPVFVISTITHDMATTTSVLIAVASVEFTFSIPTFARIDVKAANTADSAANTIHMMYIFFLNILLCLLVYLYTVYISIPENERTTLLTKG